MPQNLQRIKNAIDVSNLGRFESDIKYFDLRADNYFSGPAFVASISQDDMGHGEVIVLPASNITEIGRDNNHPDGDAEDCLYFKYKDNMVEQKIYISSYAFIK